MNSTRSVKSILYSKASQRLVDGITVGTAFYLAYQFRFAGQVPPNDNFQLWALLLPVAIFRVVSNSLCGVYKFKWRHVSIPDAIQIARIYSLSSFVLLVCRLVLPDRLHLFRIPVTVIAIEFTLSLLSALSVRLLRRVLFERQQDQVGGRKVRRLLLVGAGLHGIAVAKGMVSHKGIKIVGFVDDDPDKIGAVICGLPVLGTIADLPKIIQIHNVDEVFICILPAARNALNLEKILASSNGAAVRSRIMPTVDELLDAETVLEVLSKRGAQATTKRRPESAAMPPIVPPIQGKTILITGGAGFIGSSLAELLAPANQVVLFDLGFRGRPVEFTGLLNHPNVRTVEGSLLNGGNLRKLALSADIVVHAAAIVGVNRVCNSGRETLETNYVGTSRLLQALEASRRLERLIYFSTSEVFGVNSFRVDENTPPRIGPIGEARWSYAIAKLAGEHLVKAYYREIRMPTVIVRPFNIFGPKRTGDHALLRFILNAIAGRPIQVHGDGTQIRSWCYIEDFCAALLEMMIRPEAVGEDFNIGQPGNTLTIYELARKVLELTGSRSPIVLIESPFPDIEIRVPSLSKARKLLGFDPRYDLDSALRLTIDWYRKNEEFFSKQTETAEAQLGGLAQEISLVSKGEVTLQATP